MGINMVISPFWFILLILIFYIIVFILKRLLLPPFTIFFSKPLNKENHNDAIYMFLIYVLLVFIYTFTSTPILDFILNNNPKDNIGISLSFGIIFTGLLRILSGKYYYKEVAFIVYCQAIFNLLALLIICSFFPYECNYFLKIHDEFLFMIEQGYFKFYMIPLLIILFLFIEYFIKRITLLDNKIQI